MLEKKIVLYMLISGLKYICLSPDKKLKHMMMTLTSIMIVQLPSLLRFYSIEFETLKQLVRIPLFLDLSAMSSKDLKEPFMGLLEVLIGLYNKTESFEIVLKVTQSLAKLAREPHNLQKEAKTELTKLMHEVCHNTKLTLKKFILECEDYCLEK